MTGGPPTWYDGDTLAASDVNDWFAARTGCKDADTPRASTATPADDPDLVVAITGSGLWSLLGLLIYAAVRGRARTRMRAIYRPLAALGRASLRAEQ